MFHNNNSKFNARSLVYFRWYFTRYYIKSRVSGDKELRPLPLNQRWKSQFFLLGKNSKNNPRLQSLVKTYKSRDVAVIAIASRVATRSMLPMREHLSLGEVMLSLLQEGTAVVFNEHSSIRVKSCRRFSSANFPDIFSFVVDFDAPGVNKARTN